jgi:NADPH:quinone reductase-like Zn-dependent oxidoreductase
MGETMQAVQITRYGEEDGLELREVARPTPRAGQVLVRIRAAGVNPFDCKIRRGWLAGFYPLDLPATAGGDFAGEVAELGEGVTGLTVGERVYGMINPMQGGTYAQYLAVDAALARRAPANVDFTEVAGLPMAGQTALHALVNLGGVTSGNRVLIHAGAGGVGGMAIQIAKVAGAHVYATCSTRNVQMVRELGADEVIDYTTTDFRQVARDIDLAVDPLGDEVNLRTYEVMKPGGTILVVLRYNKTEMENRAALSARYGVNVKVVEFDNEPDLLDRLRELVEGGKVRANVRTVLPLEQAAEAQRISGSGRASGKIVLTVP